jgi:hypothetical protein
MSLDETEYRVAFGSRILAFTDLVAGMCAAMGHVSLDDPRDPNRFVVKGA